MDRRQQKTRIAIFQAFESLLTEKPYSKISVQEIIDRANVGRTTFYAHFETKDSLLKELCDGLFNHVFSKNAKITKEKTFPFANSDVKTMTIHIIYHLLDNKTNIKKLFLGESKEIFIAYFKLHLDEIINEFVLPKMSRNNSTVPTDFLKNHIASSFVDMIEWWIKRGMEETPEQLCEYYFEVIDPIL